MSFKNIKGQDSALKFLKGTLENNRISHAYIFLGPSGVGRKLAALNFAKAANCPGAIGYDACDQCPSCRKIDASNHPDVFILRPEKESSAIKIEKVRELIKDIGLKPYEGRKKVYIIDGADLMKHEASAAILKTLEEPPTDAIIILLAENLGSLLRTIVSRSQVVRFYPLGAREVEDILVKEYSIEDKKAHILSHLFSGRLGEALKYKDEEFFTKRLTLIEGLAGMTFFESDFEKISKEDLKMYLGMMLSWYRDIMARKFGAGDEQLINADKVEMIRREADSLNAGYLGGVIDQIISTGSFLDQNANPKLAMSMLAAKIRER
ncbi:MAG: DNA polymerase III subunit delta' [Candidatus Omnitrophota bacterium]